MRRVLAVLTVIVAVSCGGGGDEAANTTTTTTTEPTTTTTAPADPTVEVLWEGHWGSSVDEAFFRFVAVIENPRDEPVGGIETEWTALDADGAIVGSIRSRRPPIPAGGSIMYAGGAGSLNLAGVPAAVNVTITDPGSPWDEDPVELRVDDVTLSPVDSYDPSRQYTYEVSGLLTVPVEAESRDVAGVVVLRGDGGELVGGTFFNLENAPETIPGGSSVRVNERFVEATGPASTAELHAYLSGR